jgi:YggT family protein
MSIIKTIEVFFFVYECLLIIRIIMSYVRFTSYNPFFKFIYECTEPYVRFYRRVIPPVGMFDFSPIVAFFILDIIRRLIINLALALFIHI